MEWLGALTKQDGTSVNLDTAMYTVVLCSFVKQKKWVAARDLLVKMMDDYQEGNTRAKPDVLTVKTIVAGMCSASMLAQADDLVRASWHVACLTEEDIGEIAAIVIRAWDRALRPERAEAILTDLSQLPRQQRIYDSVAIAWKRRLQGENVDMMTTDTGTMPLHK